MTHDRKTSSQIFSTASPNRLIGYDQLAPEYGVRFSRVHLRRLEAEGKFPRRVKVSSKRVAWRADLIEEFLANLTRCTTTAEAKTIHKSTTEGRVSVNHVAGFTASNGGN